MKNKIAIILGVISVVLGAIGIFLPLLPTTPFLLLAGYFFERGSPEFHKKLLEHPKLGPPIRDWEENKRIKRKTKVIALTLIAISSYFPMSNPNISSFGKATIGLVLCSVAIFISTRNE